jgi:hypothetical protein
MSGSDASFSRWVMQSIRKAVQKIRATMHKTQHRFFHRQKIKNEILSLGVKPFSRFRFVIPWGIQI